MPDLTEHAPKSTGLNSAPPGLQRISRNEVTSCSHWLPDGSLSVLVGRHGAMNPAGKVRCNMANQIRLANHNCNFCRLKARVLLPSTFGQSNNSETLSRIQSLADYTIDTLESSFQKRHRHSRSENDGCAAHAGNSISSAKPAGCMTNHSRNVANAPVDLQFLMRGLRTADDFIELAEETFLATFNHAEGDETTTDFSTEARRKSSKDVGEIYQQIAFQNFRQCFFLSDSGCNRTYGILSGVMPTLNPALSELIAQPDPIREFKYEGACFFSAALDVKKSMLQKNPDGSYQKDQTGHVAYFLNFNGIDPNSVKIIDAPEYIKIAFQPPRERSLSNGSAYSRELTNGLPESLLWQVRYDRFVSSMIEKTSIKKFVIFEKQKVSKFPSAPVSLLLADADESADGKHD